MSKLYAFSFALLLTISFSFVQAQVVYKPGYITTPEDSRIEGLLGYRNEVSHAQGIMFKRDEMATERQYLPHQLKGYAFEQGGRYEAMPLAGADSTVKQVFLEVLVKGTASLYYLKMGDLNERFFIKKQGEELEELLHEVRRLQMESGQKYNADVKLYVGTLTQHFLDCQGTQLQIEQTRLKQPSLIKLFSRYNTCVTPSEEQYVKDTGKGLRVRLGLLAGTSFTNSQFSGNHASTLDLQNSSGFETSRDLTAGLSLDIVAPGTSEKIGLHVGVMYTQYAFEGSYEIYESDEVRRQFNYNLKASHLKVPVMLRYTYPKGILRPFVQAGVQNGFVISKESNVQEQSKYYNTNREKEYPLLDAYRGHEQGFLGGIGALLYLTEQTSLTVEGRYEINNGISAYRELEHSNRIASFLIGIMF
ncbi:outer membrane beta-barrel protein [Pontibacter pamirensis]|uniref:outer membrane beta-barrel protein n=1 Tax=Pontibacter pamirensis TaxID=2562824 RepID=UPI001389E724|nr:outer membrane beta-barrel protein [Pontibacter pamirensis]